MYVGYTNSCSVPMYVGCLKYSGHEDRNDNGLTLHNLWGKGKRHRISGGGVT